MYAGSLEVIEALVAADIERIKISSGTDESGVAKVQKASTVAYAALIRMIFKSE